MTLAPARVWQGGLILLGLILVELALLTPQLHQRNGGFGPAALPIGVGGIALLILGASWASRWQQCAGLMALALVGQASSLELMHSPPYGVYQHYLSWRQIATTPRGLFLLAMLAQTVITISAARLLWPGVSGYLSRLIAVPRMIVFLLLMIFAGVIFSRDPFRYGGELMLAGWIYSISALNLILVAAAIPADPLKEIVGRLKRQFGSDPEAGALARRWHHLLPWLAAGWVVVIAAGAAWLVFERVPHIDDEVSYLFQAKYFSTGRLYLPAPPDAAAFAFEKLHNDGTRWWGYGFPGWPAVLALGVLAGAPWLVNPLLGGLTVLLLHMLLRRLYGRSLANAAALLMAVSPWFLFMSASLMPHPVCVIWLLLALLSIEKERESGRGYWGALAGACLGALILTRPLEAVVLGPVIGLWALWPGGPRLKGRALAGLVVAGFLVGGLLFPYNYALTGDAMYTPHEKWADERWYTGADQLGFGPNIGNLGWNHLDPLPGHGLLDVIVNANKNFYMSNFELFGWSFGSLGFAALALLLGGARRADRLFLAIILAIIAGHSFYWFSGGSDIGARYWYQALVPLIVLTVRGIQLVQQRLIELGAVKLTASRVTAFVVAASLIAFINVIPWRSLGKYYRYRGMSAEIERLAHTHKFGRSLVFIQAREREDYASAFIFNPPTLEAPGTIYALDAGAAHREAVQRRFPDRPVWFVGRPPEDKGPLQVLAGPLPPESKLIEDANFPAR